MTQLWSVTCHMGLHSVTCYPTQVNTPRLNPSHAGWYSIYLPRRDGRLSWLESTPAGSRTSDLSITSPTPNHCTAPKQPGQDKFGLQLLPRTPGYVSGTAKIKRVTLRTAEVCSFFEAVLAVIVTIARDTRRDTSCRPAADVARPTWRRHWTETIKN